MDFMSAFSDLGGDGLLKSMLSKFSPDMLSKAAGHFRELEAKHGVPRVAYLGRLVNKKVVVQTFSSDGAMGFTPLFELDGPNKGKPLAKSMGDMFTGAGFMEGKVRTDLEKMSSEEKCQYVIMGVYADKTEAGVDDTFIQYYKVVDNKMQYVIDAAGKPLVMSLQDALFGTKK